MQRTMLKSKIHRATVTDCDLHYVGSITVDPDLLQAADILEFEQVAVVDVDNGARFETYTIAGERDPAAVRAAMRAVLDPVTEAEVDYLEIVDAATLAPVDPLQGELRLLGASRFGRARLLDNTGVTISAPT